MLRLPMYGLIGGRRSLPPAIHPVGASRGHEMEALYPPSFHGARTGESSNNPTERPVFHKCRRSGRGLLRSANPCDEALQERGRRVEKDEFRASAKNTTKRALQ